MSGMIAVAKNKVTKEIALINDVAVGRHCQCECLICGADLIAKQGEHLAWHFAHLEGQSCRVDVERGEGSSGSSYKPMGSLHQITQEVLGYSEARYGDHVLYRDDARWRSGGKKALFEIVSTSPMSKEKINFISYSLMDKGVSVWVINLRLVRDELFKALCSQHVNHEVFKRDWIRCISAATRRMATARDGRLSLIKRLRTQGSADQRAGWWISKNWNATHRYTNEEYQQLRKWQAFCLEHGRS